MVQHSPRDGVHSDSARKEDRRTWNRDGGTDKDSRGSRPCWQSHVANISTMTVEEEVVVSVLFRLFITETHATQL